MNAASLVKLAVLTSVALNVFSLGLGASFRDVTSLVRQPVKLAQSLLVMDLLMPCFAILLASVFEFEPAVRIALVTLSVSPVLPVLPRKNVKASALGLYTVVAVLAIVFVPLAVSFLGRAFGFTGGLSAAAVARVLATTVIVPLGLGIAVNSLAPRLALRVAGGVAVAANVLLILGLVPMLGATWRGVVAIMGNGTVFAIVAFVVGGLVLGELFGGPDPDDRAVLALSNASRHPGVALTIASATFPEEKLVVAALLVYLVVNALVSVPYMRWNRHHHPPIGSRPAVAGR